MPYIHFTEDQKLRANSVDLVEFLRRQGEKLISSGQDKRLTSDHSITVHGNEWYDHAAERGGHAISFVQNFYGLTYPEAVTRLLNGEQGEVYIPAEKKEKEPPKEFALPPSNQAMRRVYAYLLQQRHISREVLSAFAQKGLIYESRELSIDQTKVYHNAVFVGFDERGVARHAHKRGLYTQGKSYRGNIEGSDPRCSFHWVGTSDRLYVFEAPIDLLAFLTLYPDGWQQHSYVALCVYGDNVFEKDGIRRDRTGDGEKTRCLCGKRGIFNRDGPAMGPQIIRQLERRASRRSASFFHALASPGRPRNGGGASGAYQPAEGRKALIQGRFRAQEGPLGPSRKSQQQTKRTGFAALEDSIADEAPEGKRAKRANRALNRAGINSRGQKQGFGGADRRAGRVTSR